MSNEKWLFRGFGFTPNSKLGVCLRHELSIINKLNLDINDEERRRLALENLGKTIGCEIKAADFLTLGAKQYLEINKRIKPEEERLEPAIRRRIAYFENIRKRQNSR